MSCFCSTFREMTLEFQLLLIEVFWPPMRYRSTIYTHCASGLNPQPYRNIFHEAAISNSNSVQTQHITTHRNPPIAANPPNLRANTKIQSSLSTKRESQLSAHKLSARKRLPFSQPHTTPSVSPPTTNHRLEALFRNKDV